MSQRKTDEQKMLFDKYVALSTIQRHFSLPKLDAENVFVKCQERDEESGYIKIYDNRVRTEAVYEALGLSLEIALMQYRVKNEQ